MQSLNLSLKENYLATDSEIKASFNLLTNFTRRCSCESYTKAFEIGLLKKEVFLNAYSVTKLAFHQFETIQKLIDYSILPLIRLVTEQSKEQCLDEFNCRYYLKIVKMIAKSPSLNDGLSSISVAFSSACLRYSPSPQDLEASLCLTAFAIKHFNQLTALTQKHMCHTYALTQMELLPSTWSEKPDNRKFCETIKELFKNFSPTIKIDAKEEMPHPLFIWKENPSQPTSLKPSKNLFSKKEVKKEPLNEFQTFFVLTTEEEVKLTQEAQQEISKRAQQIDKVCQIFEDIATSYLPPALSSLSSSLTPSLNALSTHFLKDFKRYFRPIAAHLFFNDTRLVSLTQEEQDLLHVLFKQLASFLKDINAKKIQSQQLDPLYLQQLTHSLCQNIFEQILQKSQSSNDLPNPYYPFLASIGALIATHVFNHFPTSYQVCLVLERLLDTTLDTTAADESKPSLNSFVTNPQLSKTIGQSLYAIAAELASLGGTTGLIDLIAKGGLAILNKKKETVADKIQQLVSQIKSSSSSLFPLLVFHHFLFRQQGQAIVPTLIEPVVQDPHNLKQMQEELKQRISTKLYLFLVDLIKEQPNLTGKIGSLYSQTKGPQQSFQNLIDGIWAIIQNDQYLKLLMVYLLTGLSDVITKRS